MNKTLSRRNFLKLASLGYGSVLLSSCERHIPSSATAPPPSPSPTDTPGTPTLLLPDERWWLRPQTYHNGEGPDIDNIPHMNISVLHDWGSLFMGKPNNPDDYWSYATIQARWEEAHRRGIRVEAVISILDLLMIEVRPDDELYPFSGIDLDGDHIHYEDPPGFIGCTNQEGWLNYLEHKMMDAVDLGVDGLIIDDFEGSSRWVSGTPTGLAGMEAGPGGCFCPACEDGFRAFLQEKYTQDELQNLGIENIQHFSYADFLRAEGWSKERLGEESLKFSGWDPEAHITAPLYEDYARFQNEQVLEVSRRLRSTITTYANEHYGKEIAWSTNLSEIIYSTHQFFSYYDRSVGAIWSFGIPPRGTESYLYRLEADLYGAPRPRESPMDPLVVAVLNEYQADNLLAIKDAEAFAHRGAWIEAGYYVEEGAEEEGIQAAFHTDVQRKYNYNQFYRDNAELFDFQAASSMARTAVLYASASIKHNMSAHITSFKGICEILTDLHVQYDPLFAGDGLSCEDLISEERLSPYELLILPNTSALTDDQVDVLLTHLQRGGTIVALGDTGIINENGEPIQRSDWRDLIGRPMSEVGAGRFHHLRLPVFQADSIYDEELHDIGAAYYRYYIENSDPALAPYLYLYEDEPIPHLSEETAAAIRQEVSALVDGALSNRIVLDGLPASIGVQAYVNRAASQNIVIHLINYDYELQTDRVNDHSGLTFALLLPEGFQAASVEVRSPDQEGIQALEYTLDEGYLRCTVPQLHIWDVIVIASV